MISPEQRTCEECTACCKTHPIPRVGKLGNSWCKHCIIGVGCKIYESRHKECRAFQCQWLKGVCQDKDRPDRSKIVIDYYNVGMPLDKVLFLWEVTEGAIAGRFAKETTKHFIGLDSAVCHKLILGRDKLFIPRVLVPNGIPPSIDTGNSSVFIVDKYPIK